MHSRAPSLAGARAAGIDWAVAACSHPGHDESGDLHVVRELEDSAFIGVVDALGHGSEAEATARLAAATLDHYAPEGPVDAVARCHRMLLTTRGAALVAALLDWSAGTLSWLSIGGVEGRLFTGGDGRAPPPRALMTWSGIVGAGAPPAVRPWIVPVSAGDVLVVATDGVRETFADSVRPGARPQDIADAVLADHCKGTDDALVFVARLLHPPGLPDS